MSGGAIEREAKKIFWQNRKSQNRENAKSESERLGKLRRQKSESKSPKSFHTTSNRRELGKKKDSHCGVGKPQLYLSHLAVLACPRQQQHMCVHHKASMDNDFQDTKLLTGETAWP